MTRLHSRETRLLVLALASVPLSGCAGHASTETEALVVPEWSATEVRQIAGAGDSGGALTTIAAMAIGADDAVFVSQPMDGTIKEFDSAGRLARTFGQPGDGPGEFRSLGAIGLLGDTLYAVDRNARRVTFFSLDGHVLNSFPLTPKGLGDGWVPLAPTMLASDGSAVAQPGFLPRPGGGDEGQPVLILRVDRTGTVLDTLLLELRPPSALTRISAPMGPIWVRQPLADLPNPVVDPAGGRVAVVDTGQGSRSRGTTFRVSVLRSATDTLWARSYAYTPVPVSAAMVDSAVAREAFSLRNALPDSQEATRLIRKSMTVPEYLPAVSELRFAEDGNLWLCLSADLGKDHQWLVVDPMGQPVGRIEVPADLEVRRIQANAVWGIRRDSLDVPNVVEYAITR